MASPVSETRLKQIAADACDSALEKTDSYIHAETESWNAAIINKILQSLISESKPSPDAQPPFKFAVNSTIIQHLTDPKPTGTDGAAAAGERRVGRRGMHSAAGAYWNNEKDGMWSYKYEGGQQKGLDVVISVIWIAV